MYCSSTPKGGNSVEEKWYIAAKKNPGVHVDSKRDSNEGFQKDSDDYASLTIKCSLDEAKLFPLQFVIFNLSFRRASIVCDMVTTRALSIISELSYAGPALLDFE